MDWQHPRVVQLQRVLKSIDDDALVAMANRGLVRRALRDLDQSKVQLRAVDGDRVTVLVGTHVVSLPPLPTLAECNCPAAEICRHVLTAIVFLRDYQPEKAATVDVALSPSEVAADMAAPSDGEAPIELLESWEQFVSNVTFESLRNWAGTPLLRKAFQSLDLQTIHTSIAKSGELHQPAWRAELVERQVQIHWLPGNGLPGLLCSCNARSNCVHRVQAVLYDLRQRKAIDFTDEAWRELARPAVADNLYSRDELVRATQLLLRELFSSGTARVSIALINRLVTLSVSAHGADLPRLERELAALADTMQRLYRREAAAATTDAIARAARIRMLTLALLEHQTPEWIGEHRSEYVEVGTMHLMGMGAARWRSASGFCGLTVYFWHEASKSWFTWSETRPERQADFSPQKVYAGPGPWEGCLSPRQACRNEWQLNHTYRNRDRRLSGRAATRAILTRSRSLADFTHVVEDWQLIAGQLERVYHGSLRELSQPDDLMIVRPKAWRSLGYDSLNQELRFILYDVRGRRLLMKVQHHSQSKVVDTLETLTDRLIACRGAARLLVRLRLDPRQCYVEPLTVYLDDSTINLSLDDLPAKRMAATPKASPAIPPNDTRCVPGEVDEQVCATRPTPSARVLSETLMALTAIGERGIKASLTMSRQELKSTVERLEALGLSTVGRLLRNMMESMRVRDGETTRVEPIVDRLLEAYYVASLAAQKERVQSAVGSILICDKSLVDGRSDLGDQEVAS